jgi:hypothetical protein
VYYHLDPTASILIVEMSRNEVAQIAKEPKRSVKKVEKSRNESWH